MNFFDIEWLIHYKGSDSCIEGRSINDFIDCMFGYFNHNDITHIQNRLISLQALVMVGLINQDLGMPISIQNIMKSKNIDKLLMLYKFNGYGAPQDLLFPIILYYDTSIPTAVKSGPVEVVVGIDASASWHTRRMKFQENKG